MVKCKLWKNNIIVKLAKVWYYKNWRAKIALLFFVRAYIKI